MSLTSGIRYEKISSAFGENFKGYHASTPDEIRRAVRSALNEKISPSLINIAINPSADRKAQVSFRNFLIFFCFVLNITIGQIGYF